MMNMTSNIKNSIQTQINNMNVDEMKSKLFELLLKEEQSNSNEPACTIIVRKSQSLDGRGVKGYYDVFISDQENIDHEVMFHDRPSKALFVLALINGKGFQRRAIQKNGGKMMMDIWSMLYRSTNANIEKLEEKITGSQFEHWINQAVAQARKAIDKTLEGIDDSKWYRFSDPRSNHDMLVVPLAKDHNEKVEIDINLSEL